MPVMFRLVDGSEPEDWSPKHGDRPCTVRGHKGHSLDGCPNLYNGGIFSEHGEFQVGTDCPACVREVLDWTS